MKHTKRGPRQYKLEVAWDIEAEDWSNVTRVCGIDTEGRTIYAHSLKEFITRARELGWLRPDVRWWAHYGGIYDHYLLIAEILTDGWKISRGSYTPGMGMWSLDLVGPNGAELILRDSSRLMPESLRSVGRAFGLEKLEVDRSNIGLLSSEELDRYCMRDCEILLLAVKTFRNIWQEYGADIAATLASTSTAYLRRTAIPEDAWGWTPGQDATASAAYYGGRVERFMRRIDSSEPDINDVRYYDINSSYPWSMVHPLPTKYRGYATGRHSKVGRPNIFSIVEADVIVHTDTHIGPLPWKPTYGPQKDRLVFPVGSFTGCFTWGELEAMEETGTGSIQSIRQSWVYDTGDYLAPFIGHWYEVKKQAKTPAERFIAKLAMNSIVSFRKTNRSRGIRVCYARRQKGCGVLRTQAAGHVSANPARHENASDKPRNRVRVDYPRNAYARIPSRGGRGMYSLPFPREAF